MALQLSICDWIIALAQVHGCDGGSLVVLSDCFTEDGFVDVVSNFGHHGQSYAREMEAALWSCEEWTPNSMLPLTCCLQDDGITRHSSIMLPRRSHAVHVVQHPDLVYAWPRFVVGS